MNAQYALTTKQEEQRTSGGPALLKMLQAFPNATERSNGWWSHPDNPTFDFREREDGSIAIHSWTGSSIEAILASRQLSFKDIGRQAGYNNTQTRDRLDLMELAFTKKIDWQLLHGYGLQDGYRYHGYRYVKIPYYHEDGSQHTKIKVRKAISGKYKHCWDEGTYGELIAYGLHKLEMARQAGYLLIGEGESDAWSCWAHHVPYLGLPGASAAKCLTGVNLSAISKVYILHEPDQVVKQLADGAGFYKNVHNTLRQAGYTGEIFCIHFEEATQFKDPSELHIALWNQEHDQERTHSAFLATIQTALAQALPANDEEARRQDLPSIIAHGRQLRDITADALTALAEKEAANPTLFLQAGKIKRVGRDELYRPSIQEVSEAEMRNILTNCANFFRVKPGKEGEEQLIAVSPPKEVAQSILSLKAEELPFPPIEGVVPVPVMRADGSLLDQPGYDEATHLYYMPQHGLHIPDIPAAPTKQQVEEAIGMIADLICDFPWETDADRANAIAALLTTVTRQMFRHVPIALIDATKQGTGKGLFTDLIHLILTGRCASAISPDGKDEELNKVITALLMEGAPIITMDNVERELKSPILAKILTSEYHSGRVLGQSKMVDVPQRAIWIANGNNIQVGGDMARRSYRMRMLADVSEPDARENFKYPELAKHVLEHRGEIIAALLTIARAWFVADCPPPTKKLRKIGSFSEWSTVTGGMLSYAGVSGFLENVAQLRKEADVDGAAWSHFLELWQEKLGNEEFKTADLVERLGVDHELAEALPTEQLAFLFAKEDKTFSRVFGRTLAKQNGTPYGPQNLRLIKGEDSHAKVASFHVAGLVLMKRDAPLPEPEPEPVPAPAEKLSVEAEVATNLLQQLSEATERTGTKTLLWNVRESIYERGEVTVREFKRRIQAGILAGGGELQAGTLQMRTVLKSMTSV